ncbi:MAG TPA: M20/M25/M40 family metallo-hydrolase [Thermoleophilaceae bacterium]|nr:M20/M25/M40 family metallo-hydrolase [Thermoleophilaceae bacterium]
MSGARDLHERPVELLQRLLRFDTTNPPGSERACLEWLAGLLRDAGLETTFVAAEPARPNLVARLRGSGDAPPLLLEGHVDVVSTAGQQWAHPPFAGEIVDGSVWGRGALDMKGGVAMFVAAVLRAAATGLPLAGDVVLALVSDEEAGGDVGAAHLVRERPDLLAGVRYALGEFGGFSLDLGGRRFYPIQVAEKQPCWLRATVRGPSGHGALPMRGGAIARLAELLRVLDRRRLPVHVTSVARWMIERVAAELPAPSGALLRRLLNPRLTDRILDVMGERGRVFDPLLHHTVNATIVRGGDKINVIPAEATVELDGRLLPGFGAADLVAELRSLLGPAVELEVLRHEQGPPEPDLGLYDLLAGVLREADPSGTPVPLLLAAFTDARHFSRLGIQTYGFMPMQLPSEMRFMDLIHAADERLPVDAVRFGTDAVFNVLERYGR